MKTALVFGHSSGLGKAVTEELLRNQYKVIGIARSESDIKSEFLTNIEADLSTKEGINEAIAKIKKGFSKFDCVIYCSGILTVHDLDKLDYDENEKSFKVMVFAPMMIESGLLTLIKKNKADVLNITSDVLEKYYPKYAEYTTAKAAFQKFTSLLQSELNGTGCRVTEFMPGAFQSNIYKNMTGEKVNRDESAQPSASEYAKIIVYILNLPKNMQVRYIYADKNQF